MLDVFHIAKPQNCDIQTFIGTGGASIEYRNGRTWNKPRGVSHIYMMLIGAGGNGGSTDGGGSGAVTVWYGAAQHVPDSLVIFVAGPYDNPAQTRVAYRITASNSLINLLTADNGSASSNGNATASNNFAASGFYQSTAGQNGAVGAVSPSATTFLSGGAGSGGQPVTANYGYQTNVTGTGGAGYFQLQPIIVGVGSANINSAVIGCGGAPNGNATGPGFVLIASW